MGTKLAGETGGRGADIPCAVPMATARSVSAFLDFMAFMMRSGSWTGGVGDGPAWTGVDSSSR